MDEIQYLDSSHRYSKAVIHGNTVYLAGQVADDPGAPVQEQMRQILAQIDALLARCGTDKSKVLSANVLLKDMRDLAAINPVWDEWVVPGRAPARTPSEARLALPGYLVEVQVTAAR
ncbi:RidA family protein [Orrella sp. JC864]|uniref:RidA family protein n=1 Tax=Orrella sp. JC864 TaxID=3120298 RepID=UPI0030092E7E